MPFINGKFYANPAYGRGVEKARTADLVGRGDGQGEAELISAETHPQKATQSPTVQRATQKPSTAKSKHHGDDYNPATTPEGVGNQIYNETAGLRPTSKSGTGPGTDWDMQQARKAMAHVIQNRATHKMQGGLTNDQIDSRETRAIASVASAAYDAHGGSQAAAHDAARDAARQYDPTGGSLHFYLDDPKKKPPKWVNDAIPVAEFGPFQNVSGHGDVSRGEPVRIKIF